MADETPKLADKNSKNQTGLIVLFLVLIVAGWILYFKTNHDLNQTKVNLGSDIARLTEELNNYQEENRKLSDNLVMAQNRNIDFENQIGQIHSTVTNLTKLSEIEPQLLQKYSKTYFLNENYVPSSLDEIPFLYRHDQQKLMEIETRVAPFLRNLLDDAERANVGLRVLSAYRSFGTQSSLKSNYKVIYGAGTANQFSADQGYSEHQLGTALDFTTVVTSGNLDKFEGTEAYQWLLDNAYKYGFVLSYPKGNSYYQFEPWHWRFVGRTLATNLREHGQNLYDLSQREIDEYLISLFD